MAKFPLSQGKIPGIEMQGLRLTETIAIVTYLSKFSNNAALLGDGSREQEASVLALMSWANQELLPTLALWFLPLIPGFIDPPPYSYSTVESGKAKSLILLTRLEEFVAGKQWLIGDHLTAADIMLAIYLSRGFEWVLDAKWREGHPNIMKHFLAVVGQDAVKRVVPEFVLIETATPNVNPYEQK
ncbi:hypothetical protein RJ55_04028 [Drechmeria coniospora]|nr:hypothetical protein RJ55_04028 [Drechmeria coniospora]